MSSLSYYNNTGGGARKVVLRLIQRDGRKCWICGLAVSMRCSFPNAIYPTVDHVKAKALGGSNEMDNFKLAHKLCNEKRGIDVRLVPEHLRSQQRLLLYEYKEELAVAAEDERSGFLKRLDKNLMKQLEYGDRRRLSFTAE